MTTLSVVVPMYRTAQTLEELHQRVTKSVPKQYVLELVFVDDACDQGSEAALSALRAADPKIVTIKHETNQGQHQAIRTGLRKSSGDLVAVIDADLQDPPEALPALIDHLHSAEVDAVFAGKSGGYEGIGRRTTGTMFKRALRLLADIPPGAGSYVVMTRALVDDVVARDIGTPYLLATIAATGRTTCAIPVDRGKRPVGVSGWSRIARLKLGAMALWALFRERLR